MLEISAAGPGDTMGRWRVICIPGLFQPRKDHFRDLVTDQLRLAEAVPLVESPAPPDQPAGEARTLTAHARHAHRAEFESIEVVEAYWGDLITGRQETNPAIRLLSALSLLGYWVLDIRMLRALLGSTWFLAVGHLLAAVALLTWTASILITFAHWAPETITQEFGDSSWLVALTPSWLRDAFGELLREDSGWGRFAEMFAILAPMLSLLSLVDIARFSRAYLEDEADKSGIGVRTQIRGRIREAFLTALQGDYDRIILLAHSFAPLPLADLLADWGRNEDLAKVKVITVGSASGVFAVKSAWLRGQVKGALARSPGAGWVDFVLAKDFWCGGLLQRPDAEDRAHYRRVRLTNTSSLFAGFSGKIHLSYFGETAIMNAILTSEKI